MITRRNFIKGSIVGNLLLLSSGPIIQGCKRSVSGGYKFLSDSEAETLRAFTMRLIPPGGPIPPSAEDVGVVRKIDEALAQEDRDVQKQFSMALFLFEFAPLFSRKFARFTNLSESDQVEVMKNWSRSRWQLKRNVFNAMKDLSMFMYYTTDSVWQYIGYDGPLVGR